MEHLTDTSSQCSDSSTTRSSRSVIRLETVIDQETADFVRHIVAETKGRVMKVEPYVPFLKRKLK